MFISLLILVKSLFAVQEESDLKKVFEQKIMCLTVCFNSIDRVPLPHLVLKYFDELVSFINKKREKLYLSLSKDFLGKVKDNIKLWQKTLEEEDYGLLGAVDSFRGFILDLEADFLEQKQSEYFSYSV